MIAVRFALYGALGGLFGLSAFSLYSLRPGERREALALRAWLTGTALVGLVLSAVALALLAASMAGAPPWPIDRDAVGVLLAGSAMGAAWKVRMVALVVVALAALAGGGRTVSLGLVTIASGLALASLAWSGHGAMDEGAIGWTHLAADVLHLLAAGAWTGALLGLILLMARRSEEVGAAHLLIAHRALHGFAVIGTIIVGTIIVTGLVNAWLLVGVGNALHLGATLYGRLLLAKLALFAAMLALASVNRFRLTPAFNRSIAARDHAGAIGQLRLSLAVEATSALVILALVAWLGMLKPPASM